MDKKNSRRKKRIEKGLSLFEIFILIASIVSISYFLGNEFQFVSANVPNTNPMPSTESNPITLEEAGIQIGETRVAPVLTTTGASAAPAAAPVPAPNPASSAASATDVTAGIPGGPTTPGGLQEGVTSGLPESTSPGSTFPSSLEEFGGRLWNNIGNILINAAIAAGLYYGTRWIGSLVCPTCSQNFLDSFGLALSLGYGVGSGIGTLIGALGGNSLPILGLSGAGFGLIGVGVGLILFLIFFRDVKISAVVFSCFPWQPVTGGSDCAKCNTGEFPCTQYKCQSLGQGCELLNPGTSTELCTWVNRNDIAPPIISAWTGPLDKNKFQYVPDTARLPPDKGVIIKDKTSSDGCIAPFTKLYYGISLDKPGLCKAEVTRTNSFSNMSMVLSSGYYLYNHTLFSIHAGANESESEGGVSLPNGGNYEVFIRCQSRNGYSNLGTFAFKYCVSDEPDTTPPTIELANPINGMPVQYGTTSIPVQIYTNKPADCKWSHNDEDYDTMAETMQCSQSITDINANMLYKCTTTLTGLKDSTENNFYFRCKSYPNAKSSADRFKNEQSYVYKLIGTKPLVIDSLLPQSGATIKDATANVKVTLEVKTSAGYNNGEAKCYFKKTSESDKNYVLFLNTNSYLNSQDLWLPSGSYKYSINCCDLGGNCASKTTEFEVDTDFQSPIIARAYNEGNNLKIITTENAECVYDTTSCSYNFDDGLKMTSSDNINHVTEWNTNSNFYIKCKDEFGNQPAPDGCSMIVRPFND